MAGALLFDEAEHRYMVDGRIIPSVTQIISTVGLYEFDFVSDDTLAVAAERGRNVHSMIEFFEQGELDFNTIDQELQGYFDAYLEIKKVGLLPAHPIRIEYRAWSEKYNYAGTIDQEFEGDWLNDHKTGSKSPVHGLQLSAYWLMLHPDMSLKPKKLTCDYLSRDGSYEVVEDPYEPLPWLAVLADYHWRLKNNCIRNRWK